MANSVFLSFRLFSSMNSGSRQTCGDSSRPQRQKRNTKFPSLPFIWQIPNAEKVDAKTTPASVHIVTIRLLRKYWEIPRDLYEAAEVDGAGKLKRFFYITVPQVRQMFFVTMILTVVGAFTVFNEPYILTGGGPGTATMVLSLHMYQTGFVKNNMGYASTIAMLIFVITAILSSVQFASFGTEKEDR